MEHNIYQADGTALCQYCGLEIDLPNDNPLLLYYVYREFQAVDCEVTFSRFQSPGQPPSGSAAAAAQVTQDIQISSDMNQSLDEVKGVIDKALRNNRI